MPQRRDGPELKLLYGIESHDRVDDRPAAPLREPERPSALSGAERRIWNHVVAELREMGTLSSADTLEITAYVRLVAMVERMHIELARVASYAVTSPETGVVHIHPLLTAYDRLTGRMHVFASSLGLNPHGRSLIHGRTVKANTEADHARELYA